VVKVPGEQSPAALGAAAADRAGRTQRVIHDALNRPRATPALRAATEAAINLAGGTRARVAGFYRRAHVLVGQHVAGTNDHGRGTKSPEALANNALFQFMQSKMTDYNDSNLYLALHDAD